MRSGVSAFEGERDGPQITQITQTPLLNGISSEIEAILRGDMNDQTIESAPATIETDLLDPYEKLVTIEILGKTVQVPEKNRLLRCFQYLSLNSISYGDFCWNGDCTNCQVWYHMEGQTQERDKPALACRMEVVEGMVVTTLSRFIELDGINRES